MTNTLKYSLGALGFIILLFLYNHNSQKSHTVAGEASYTGQRENVARIVISENEKLIELVKKDTTWSITQADSLLIKENQIDKVFDRLLIVEQEMLMSSKEEKWEKFGVEDGEVWINIGYILADNFEEFFGYLGYNKPLYC